MLKLFDSFFMTHTWALFPQHVSCTRTCKRYMHEIPGIHVCEFNINHHAFFRLET